MLIGHNYWCCAHSVFEAHTEALWNGPGTSCVVVVFFIISYEHDYKAKILGEQGNKDNIRGHGT